MSRRARVDQRSHGRTAERFDIGPFGFVVALVALVALACTSTAVSPPPTSSSSTGSPGATSSVGSAPPSGSTGPGGSAPGTAVPSGGDRVGAPVDFGKVGPYQVGMQHLAVGDTDLLVFYPAAGDAIAGARHITSYSSGDAFSPELRAMVASVVPELVQDIPLDVYAEVRINDDGPFPVIVHSHGFGGSYLFSSQHFSHLASWGFVVAAPDHRSRNLAAVAAGRVATDGDPDVADLSATLDLLTAQNAAPDSPIKGGLDTQMVGAEGHSAGGRASYLLAARDPRVKVWIGQAPSAPVRREPPPPPADPAAPPEPPLTPEQELAALRAALASAPTLGKPSMIVSGEKDTVVPLAENRLQYDWLAAPARLIVVKNSGHAGFIDACKPIRDQGGLQKYAEKLPAFAPLFKLGDDGCAADNIDPVKASAFTNHVMIAQYRIAFGEDPTDASLRADYLRRQFPEAFAEEQSKR